MAAQGSKAQLDQDQQDKPWSVDDELARITRQLSPPSGSVPIQGFLLKRSETLRIWNQRWFTLDPTTARMEYRIQRTDPYPKGLIMFDSESTITVSPINFHGAKEYDGCCFYIGTAGKKECFLCAATPGAARAWVETLRAAALVLKAHRDAVDSLAGGPKKAVAGAVATATAAANATAREAMKEVTAANQKTLQGTLSFLSSPASPAPHPPLSASSSLPSHSHSLSAHSAKAALPSSASEASGAARATLELQKALQLKDEEVKTLLESLKAKDEMVTSLVARLGETAAAAEAAAHATESLERERKETRAEMLRLCDGMEKRLKEMEGRVEEARREAKAVQEQKERAAAELLHERARGSRLQEMLQAALAKAEEAERARQVALQLAETWKSEALRTLNSASSHGASSGATQSSTLPSAITDVIPVSSIPSSSPAGVQLKDVFIQEEKTLSSQPPGPSAILPMGDLLSSSSPAALHPLAASENPGTIIGRKDEVLQSGSEPHSRDSNGVSPPQEDVLSSQVTSEVDCDNPHQQVAVESISPTSSSKAAETFVGQSEPASQLNCGSNINVYK